MGRFPIQVRILFVPAALILLFLLAVLTGIVRYATFKPGSGTPDIVRQFRQAPITGEVSPVVLDPLFADRGATGFLQKVTDAGFFCQSGQQSITCVLSDDNFPCVDTFRILGMLSGDGRIDAIRAFRKTNCA